MPEYAWIYLNKQDSEYASGPKYAKILNMAKFWIWEGYQYTSVTRRCEYPRISLDRVLNISRVLNMPGFWICNSMAEYVWIGQEYTWICLDVR